MRSMARGFTPPAGRLCGRLCRPNAPCKGEGTAARSAVGQREWVFWVRNPSTTPLRGAVPLPFQGRP